MRMFNKKILKECAEKINYGPEPDTIAYLLKQKKRIKEVQVQMDERDVYKRQGVNRFES